MATPPFPQPPAPEKTGPNVATALLGGSSAALLAAVVYLFTQVQDLKQTLKKDSTDTRASLQAQIDQLAEKTMAVNASTKEARDQFRAQLAAAREEGLAAASRARQDAVATATSATQETARKLEAQQQQNMAKVTGEISDVKEQASTANTKIDTVSSDVSNVKTKVDSTKSELDKTISELRSVRGDLTNTNSLVATNGSELAALRRRGERNYTEFKLVKTKDPQRVADIMLLLKKTDPKRNKFTVEVRADDKATEKKDKNINEPVQFYVSKAALPYEIVINEVRKDQISGYLATPKDRIPR